MSKYVIIDEHGDLDIYSSTEEACADLEVIDVKNNEFVAYDSDGYVFKIHTQNPNGFFRKLIPKNQITMDITDINKSETLKEVVKNFLLSVKALKPDSKAELSDLIEALWKHKNG